MKNKPVCYVPSIKHPEVYSGVPSFLGLPVIKNEEDLESCDVVIQGVPWEGVCTYGGFSLCEVSPKRIRQASIRYGGYLPDYDFDAFDVLKGGDIGDVPIQNGNEEFSFDSMRKSIRKILDKNKIPITFGGDHSISFPLISEFAKKYKGKIGIIQFDAHLDNMPSFGEKSFARCSPFYNLYKDENVDPKNLVHFGIRGPRNNYQGLKVAEEFGANVITGMEIKLNGIQASIEKAIKLASDGTDAVYISICSDILDVSCNPAGPPDHCGLTSWELAYALHQCGLKCNTLGYDFVELYPMQDPNNYSGHVATWMTIYFLVGLAQRFKK